MSLRLIAEIAIGRVNEGSSPLEVGDTHAPTPQFKEGKVRATCERCRHEKSPGLVRSAKRPPEGSDWLHEIKHDHGQNEKASPERKGMRVTCA